MTAPRKLTAKRVRELLDCDPSTGTLTWKWRPDVPRRWNTRYAGKTAGCLRKTDGYLTVRVDGVAYLAHRLVFFHQKGYWPPATLDHKNGDRQKNGIADLRPATIHQNNMNLDRSHIRKRRAHPRGCWQDPKSKRWQVHIQAYGKRVCVGWFDTAEAASRAYQNAAADLHGEFAFAERPASGSAAA
jgi:hypothetical protein